MSALNHEVLFRRVIKVSDVISKIPGIDVSQTCSVIFDNTGTLTLRFVNEENFLISKIVYCLRQSRVLEVVYRNIDQSLRVAPSSTLGYYILRIDGNDVPLTMSSEDFELFFDVAKQYLCTN